MTTPVTALLETIDQRDVAVLDEVIEHDGITEEIFTHEEAMALWEVGWREWLYEPHTASLEDENESWESRSSAYSPQLWHITLGVFLHRLYAPFPALPWAPAGAQLWDIEEE